MPEQSASERTEEATQRKRDQAREQGTVGKSRDLSAAVILMLAVLFFYYLGGWMFADMSAIVGSMIERACSTSMDDSKSLKGLFVFCLQMFAQVLGPFLICLVFAGLAVNFSMVGFHVSWESLNLKPDRINPIAGFERMFGMRTLVQLIMSLGKVGLVMAVAYSYCCDAFPNVQVMTGLTTGAAFSFAADIVVGLMLRLAALLLILALFDMWYQRYQVEQDLKMTKQEVKEEMKDTEGDPHIRSRRRQIQREMAQKRMMQSVPKADVVVRNPTHYAVALAYDMENDKAPTVVAKGVDHMALRIIEIATEHGVPQRRVPWLARKLYRLEIGDEVPQELFTAVAEVLAYVYKHEKRGKHKLAS